MACYEIWTVQVQHSFRECDHGSVLLVAETIVIGESRRTPRNRLRCLGIRQLLIECESHNPVDITVELAPASTILRLQLPELVVGAVAPLAACADMARLPGWPGFNCMRE